MAVALRFIGIAALRELLVVNVQNATPERRREIAAGVGVLAMREHGEYFRREASPALVPWAQLSPVTLKIRYQRLKRPNSKVFSWRILQDRGWLRMSVTPGQMVENLQPRGFPPGFYSAALGAIRRVDARGFDIGTNLDYAHKHQYGYAGGERVMITVPEHQRGGYMVAPYVRSDGTPVKAHPVKRHKVREHQRNTITRPIPARPFVGWSDTLIEKSQEYMLDHFVTEVQ